MKTIDIADGIVGHKFWVSKALKGEVFQLASAYRILVGKAEALVRHDEAQDKRLGLDPCIELQTLKISLEEPYND